MIICGDLNLIFIKTKKVDDTSFEIALSKYCNNDDIITPISIEDEKIRSQLGFQEPINYTAQQRKKYKNSEHRNRTFIGDFENHMSSESICNQIGSTTFSSFTKISIQREPLDFLISQFFFRNRNKKPTDKVPFKTWLRENYTNVQENYEIAPTSGPYSVDKVLRYETLIDDINSAECLPDDFASIFESLNAKGNIRDPNSRDVVQFFETHGCEEYIEKIQRLI